jgi:hypothetical protein
MPDYPISVLIQRREEYWVAQCLQYDMAAQAKSLQDLMYELQRTLIGYLCICEKHGVEPFSNVPPAPASCWENWQHAISITLHMEEAAFRVPNPSSHPLPRPEYRIAA